MYKHTVIRLSLWGLLTVMGTLLITACPEDAPPARETTIHLSVVHEGTFSVKLKVSVEDSSDVWTFELTRDDSTVNTVIAEKADTTITDGRLNPGQTYRYRAYFLQNGERADSSVEVYANTLDTTSHNFVFEIDTLGNYGSFLNDVAIVDEDNIWVVGYIKAGDYTYNAAHWDGDEWELININFAVYYNTDPSFIDDAAITAVFYCKESNTLCFTSLGALTFYRDLTTWDYIEMEPMNGIPGNAIWGSSPEDVWFVGDNGSIVYYDGTSFERMESGTEYPLRHVFGLSGDNIWVTGDDEHWHSSHTCLLFFNGNEWSFLYNENYPGPPPEHPPFFVGDIRGIWCDNDLMYVITNVGLWRESKSSGGATMDEQALYGEGFPYDIDANHSNDIFVVGDRGLITHFNGRSWEPYFVAQGEGVSVLRSVSIKDDQVVIVGKDGTSHALVLYGRR